MAGVGAELRRHLATIREVFWSIADKLAAPATNLLADPPGVLAAHDEFADVFGGIVVDAAEQAGRLPASGIPIATLREVHRLLSVDVVRDDLGHDRQKFVEKYVADHPVPNIKAVQNDAFGYEDDFRRQLSRAAGSRLQGLEDAVQALLGDLEGCAAPWRASVACLATATWSNRGDLRGGTPR